jgi:hypothetical protein
MIIRIIKTAIDEIDTFFGEGQKVLKSILRIQKPKELLKEIRC